MTDSWLDTKDFAFLVGMQESGFLIVEHQFVVSHFHFLVVFFARFCLFHCQCLILVSFEMKVLAVLSESIQISEEPLLAVKNYNHHHQLVFVGFGWFWWIQS